jgi:hypothetical protein
MTVPSQAELPEWRYRFSLDVEAGQDRKSDSWQETGPEAFPDFLGIPSRDD